MGVSASLTYNQVRNTVQKNTNSSYYTHVYSADITYSLPKDFILATDVDYTFNTGLVIGAFVIFGLVIGAFLILVALKNRKEYPTTRPIRR